MRSSSDSARTCTARRGRNVRKEYLVEARYKSQVWELDTPLPVTRFRTPKDVAALVEAFHTVHDRVYAVRDEQSEVECVNWRGRIAIRLSKPARPVRQAGREPQAKTVGAACRLFRTRGLAQDAGVPRHRACARRLHRRSGDHRGADHDHRRLSDDERLGQPVRSLHFEIMSEAPDAQGQTQAALRRARPRGHDRDRQSARRRRARDDQYAVARGALRGHFQRPRFLLLHSHRRQSSARICRRPAGAHLRRPPAGREHVPLSCGRHPRGRCVSRQRPLRRQHSPGRPHLPGAGVHRRRAPVHHRCQMSHGGHRQQHSVELLRQGARRLRGRGAGVPGRAHSAQLPQ